MNFFGLFRLFFSLLCFKGTVALIHVLTRVQGLGVAVETIKIAMDIIDAEKETPFVEKMRSS